MIGTVIQAIAAAKVEQDEFNALCERLPKDEADELRKRRRKQIKLDQKQRDRIEVAKAGRSRNFWGNY